MQGKVTTEETMPAVYAGIDVCKARLDVHLHPIGTDFCVANDAAGRRCLARRLTRAGVTLAVMEPTSTYHRASHRHLAAAGIAVALVDPLRARLFAQATGQRAKTDAIDARMLAVMAQCLQPEADEPPSQAAQALAELAQARAHAIANRIAAGNRLETDTLAVLRQQARASIRQLTRHITRIESEITALIAADPALARRAAILRSIPGIGPVNVVAILAWMRELGHIDGKQATALAGLAPFARDSGHTQGQRSIRGGRAPLRRCLYMAAVAAARCNPELKAFYQNLRDRGKPAKLALIAVARKLIVLANTLLAQNRTWELKRP